MNQQFLDSLAQQTESLKHQGLFKKERVITSPQQSHIKAEGESVINLCANNYLGLSNHPRLIEAAKKALDDHGFGLSSVRFICGNSGYSQRARGENLRLGMEDTILYSSCFDANGGLFETLLGPEDAIISDALNHASIIDGIRLSEGKEIPLCKQ